MRSTAREQYDSILLRSRNFDGRPVVTAYEWVLLGRSSFYRVAEDDFSNLLNTVESVYSYYESLDSEEHYA